MKDRINSEEYFGGENSLKRFITSEHIKLFPIILPGFFGAFVILIWNIPASIFGNLRLQPEFMDPLTACCFISISTMLFLFSKSTHQVLTRKLRGLFFFSTFFIISISLSTLIPPLSFVHQFLYKALVGFEDLNATVHFSQILGLSFLVFTLSVIIRMYAEKHSWLIIAADLFSFGGLILSVVMGFGFVLGVEQAYQYNPSLSLTLDSLTFLLISFLVSIFVKKDQGLARFFLSPLAGSAAARKLFPSIILTGLMITWISWKAQEYGYFSTNLGVIFSLTVFLTLVSFVLWFGLRNVNQSEIEKNILQNERNRLYELPNHLLCILDLNSNFRSVNFGFSEVLGYQSEELVGRSTWDFIHPDDRSKTIEVQQRGATKVIQSFENRYRAKDGTYKWLRWTGTILDNMNYGAAIDVTLEKKQTSELQQAFKSMQQLSFRLHQAQEEERSRISREIHDELGQSLTVLKMEMFAFKKHFPDDSNSQSHITRILKSIDDLIHSVRNVVAELRPAALEDLGLVATVEWWLEGVRKRTGLEIQLNVGPQNSSLNLERETALFRVLQESVNNALKHSKTDRIEIFLEEKSNVLELIVRDYGHGMNETELNKLTSSGIMGMRERVRPYGGDILISNSEDGGVKFRARMPVKEGVYL